MVYQPILAVWREQPKRAIVIPNHVRYFGQNGANGATVQNIVATDFEIEPENARMLDLDWIAAKAVLTRLSLAMMDTVLVNSMNLTGRNGVNGVHVVRHVERVLQLDLVNAMGIRLVLDSVSGKPQWKTVHAK